MKMIDINGSAGGGQMLRTALSLAMVTGKPFCMRHIRGKRKKPGLMRQHLTGVHAACEISGGCCDGAEIGSTELVFHPGKVRPGDYHFSIGTAGSTSLLLQTLLPALWSADGPSTLRIEGGTHNPMAPPCDFIQGVFLPAMAQMGAHASLELLETGFAPVGGGAIRCEIEPCAKFRAHDWHDRGELIRTSARVLVRELPRTIAQRMLDAAVDSYPCDEARIETLAPSPGRGVVCIIEATFEHAREIASTFGELGVSAEKVGHRAGKWMQSFIGNGAAVGSHLADQLLLPMALAGGGGFTTMVPDDHVATNIAVIRHFLDVDFVMEEAAPGQRRITVRSGVK